MNAKRQLITLMEQFIADELDESVGWIPDNMETLMANAAFNVVEAVNITNVYLENEKIIN